MFLFYVEDRIKQIKDIKVLLVFLEEYFEN